MTCCVARFIRFLKMLSLSTVLLVTACSGFPAGLAVPLLTASATPPAAVPISTIRALPDRPVRFTQISISEGLSQSVVNDILQDRQGFLWFATQDGLNRFDGNDFTVYTHDSNDPNSLSHNHITAVIEDRQGKFWVGTFSNGLNHLDPATGQAKHYLPDEKRTETLGGSRVTALLEDHEGTVWVGTIPGGLDRYNPVTGSFQHYLSRADDPGSLSYNTVIAIYETRDGTIWVGTGKGLNRFDRSTGKFTRYYKQSDGVSGLSNDTVLSLSEDHLGRLLIGNDTGLDRLDPATGQFTHLGADQSGLAGYQVTAVLEDSAGVLWAGTFGAGLCRLKVDDTQFTCFQHDPLQSDSPSVNDVLDLYEDRSGILWVGTYGGGVNQLDAGYKHFEHISSSPPSSRSLGGDLVFSVYQDAQDVLWVGMDGAGMEKVDRKTGEITRFRHNPEDKTSLSSDKVYEIYQDHTGVFWIGTSVGLDRFDPVTNSFFHYSAGLDGNRRPEINNVCAIREDAQGNLWVAGDRMGVTRFDRKTGAFTRYASKPDVTNSLASNAVSYIYFDSAGILWIGTQNRGLDRFDPRTETFNHFTSRPDDPQSLSDNFVLGIYEDHEKNLWVGTTVGFNRLDRASGKFQTYHVKDGLPNEFVYDIQEDRQGRLWLSTNKGISRFDPKTNIFKNFDVRDGLQSNEFNGTASYQAPDGEMFYGGVGGITMFFPDEIRDNPYAPPVVLTSLVQHGEQIPVRAGEEIEVRWPENNLDFNFAVLNYTRPENNQYAYMLEGFDRAWNNIENRHSGRYTNLPGGTYTLRLKGSNNDGVWNENGASISVRVFPPFWATWWFRGAAVILIGMIAVGGVRLRTRSMEMRNLELERLVQARTTEIQQLYEQTKELAIVEERNRLARDLHDSAKQKAFAALAQLGAANGLVRTSDPSKASMPLREAENLVYEVIEELTFLIQEMYPVALKEKGLATVLREYIFEWESRNDIAVVFHIENEHPLPLQVEQALYRVTQEALANVSRHSQASQVMVQVNYTRTQVEIDIIDDGQGFQLGKRPAGVGLRSMQERVVMIGGTLVIESAPGKGTKIIVCAPTEGAAPEAAQKKSE